ncbi:sulfur carrier protein ThiS [Vibrio pectenicida]|uniref:Sulfur carrier protein ThiS n=1 Tax=Vibrio pectenicida TaxID=62763 RepID=A0A7Y4EFV8_9VIBR|nr:sulfur carrier protein ThiS [Vibrio pectenicida]NOH72801.1 sulfur carrier protein ThiS [Vibrio pectenicida]
MTSSQQSVTQAAALNSDVITITINEQSQQAVNQSNLQQIIDQLGLSDVGHVFSINNQVIPRSEWSNTVLSEGDRICLFQAIAGG